MATPSPAARPQCVARVKVHRQPEPDFMGLATHERPQLVQLRLRPPAHGLGARHSHGCLFQPTWPPSSTISLSSAQSRCETHSVGSAATCLRVAGGVSRGSGNKVALMVTGPAAVFGPSTRMPTYARLFAAAIAAHIHVIMLLKLSSPTLYHCQSLLPIICHKYLKLSLSLDDYAASRLLPISCEH